MRKRTKRERPEREPYKQFMFHFSGHNSIDGRSMNKEELNWSRNIKYWYENYHTPGNANHSKYNADYKSIINMFKLWRTEELM